MARKVSLFVSTTYIPLMDTEREIFYPTYSLYLMQIRQNLFANQIESENLFRVVMSSIATAIVSHTYPFPEFISWLTSYLYPQWNS